MVGYGGISPGVSIKYRSPGVSIKVKRAHITLVLNAFD